jgi:hypothetical protein
MARPAKKAAAKAPEPTEEYEYGEYVDKEPTAVHKACAEWIEEMTGYEVDIDTLKLTLLLYNRFQKSEGNQERIRQSKENAARLAEEREARPAAKKAPAGRRRQAAEVDEDEAEEAPARGRRGGATAVAGPAKKTATRGRRRPAPAAPVEDDDLG